MVLYSPPKIHGMSDALEESAEHFGVIRRKEKKRKKNREKEKKRKKRRR